MINIRTNVRHDDQLDIVLRRVEDMTVPLRQAGVYMESSIGKNFNSSGRPRRWKALSPATLKRRRGGGGKILQDRGVLRASITSSVDFRQVTPTSYEFGTNVVYAAAHNFGYKHIPARPFAVFQEEDSVRIAQIFQEYVERGG